MVVSESRAAAQTFAMLQKMVFHGEEYSAGVDSVERNTVLRRSVPSTILAELHAGHILICYA